jgi:hypothetical protein
VRLAPVRRSTFWFEWEPIKGPKRPDCLVMEQRDCVHSRRYAVVRQLGVAAVSGPYCGHSCFLRVRVSCLSADILDKSLPTNIFRGGGSIQSARFPCGNACGEVLIVLVFLSPSIETPIGFTNGLHSHRHSEQLVSCLLTRVRRRRRQSRLTRNFLRIEPLQRCDRTARRKPLGM